MKKEPLNFWMAIVVLFIILVLDVVVVFIFHGMGFKFQYGDPKSSVISVISTGMVISVYMGLSGISYRSLFHPSSNSI